MVSGAGLSRGAVTAYGSRVWFVVNGNPLGARRLDGPIQNGQLFTFVEVNDAAVGPLVLELKSSIAELQAQ